MWQATINNQQQLNNNVDTRDPIGSKNVGTIQATPPNLLSEHKGITFFSKLNLFKEIQQINPLKQKHFETVSNL